MNIIERQRQKLYTLHETEEPTLSKKNKPGGPRKRKTGGRRKTNPAVEEKQTGGPFHFRVAG